MSTETVRFPTLVGTIWESESWLKNMVLAAGGALLLTIAAKIQIPFYPVPMTMQTFVVLALGMAFGARLGAATVALYLVAGAFGLPVFSGTPEKGIGLAYMMGPTGGYLLGFVLAAALTGWLAEKGWDRRMVSTFLAMLAGNILIYVPGLLWLGSLVGWDKPVMQWGMTPFLLGDLVKIVIAMVVLPAAWKAVRRSD